MGAALGFHLVSTLVFVLGSAVVSWRLLSLSRRSHQAPELLLGLAILGSAVLGYGVLIAGMILRGQAPADEVSGIAMATTAVGKTLHDVGVSCFLLFVLKVFRPNSSWARVLAAAAGVLMWGGMITGVLGGSLRADDIGSAPWLCEYVVIWSYPLWMMYESLRYWGLMRRRLAVGLGDVMVTNRFLVWGVGSMFSAAAIWTASAPFLLVDKPELAQTLTPLIYIMTATAGLASISCSYLAFLPPDRYRAWVEQRAAAKNGLGAATPH